MLSSEHCFLGKADKVLKAAEKGTEKRRKYRAVHYQNRIYEKLSTHTHTKITHAYTPLAL